MVVDLLDILNSPSCRSLIDFLFKWQKEKPESERSSAYFQFIITGFFRDARELTKKFTQMGFSL